MRWWRMVEFSQICVCVADHSDVVLAGFRTLLAENNIHNVHGCNSGAGLLAKVVQVKPDILFVLWTLPEVNVRQFVKQVRGPLPGTRVVVMLQDESDFGDAIHCDADGYIARNTKEFVLPTAIECVLTVGAWIGPNVAKYLLKGQGRILFHSPVELDVDLIRYLTPKERQIAQLLVAGWDNAAISSYLVVAEDTVRVHIKNIGEKVGAMGREAVRSRLMARRS